MLTIANREKLAQYVREEARGDGHSHSRASGALGICLRLKLISIAEYDDAIDWVGSEQRQGALFTP